MSSNSLSSQDTTAIQINFSREGRGYLDNFGRALQTLPIGLSILKLAWTAGPLTFIALQIGYYIGFGKLAPWDLVIYFASYTLIAGIVGASVKFTFDWFNKEKINQAKLEYTNVVDNLTDAYLKSQDFYLYDLDETQKQFYSAKILLSNIFITPATLEYLVAELTNDQTLAKLIRKIVLYRRAGLQHYAEQVLHEIKQQYHEAFCALETKDVDVFNILMQHLSDDVPPIKQGVARTEGFLERIIAAARTNNLQTISTSDIQELLNLTIEILIGRQFPYFSFQYRGNKNKTDAFQLLEKTRNELLVVISAYYGRIMSLTTILYEDSVHGITDASSEIDMDTILPDIHGKINDLVNNILQNLNKKHKTREIRLELRHQTQNLSYIIKLYKKLRAQSLRLNKKLERFNKAALRWEKLNKKHGGKQAQVHMRPFGRGIKLNMDFIQLSEEKRQRIASMIAEYLDENKFFTQAFYRRSPQYQFTHTAKLAVDIVSVLDEELNISNPMVQNIVQATHAIVLDGIDIGTSASYRLGMIHTLCEEIKTDMKAAAKQMIKIMRVIYKVKLNEQSIEYLQEKYDIEPEFFETLTRSVIDEETFLDIPNKKAAHIPPENRRWLTTLSKAQHYLKNL